MLDTFNHGSVDRISPERPVPVFRPGNVVHIPGGAANVARNVTALGGICSLVGIAGQDEVSKILNNLLERDPNLIPYVVSVDSRPTSHKVRFTASGQHLLRMDHESSDPIGNIEIDTLIRVIAPLISQHDVLILSDYAKGMLTPALLQEVISLARSRDMPVIVDPKSQEFTRYSGATLLTPNTAEAERALGVVINTDREAEDAGKLLLASGNIEAILITRGSHGMSLILKDGHPIHMKSHALEVFDVVGAGDTVIATLACTLAAGGTLVESMTCANVAASLVVAKPDTATTGQGELIDRLISLSSQRQQKGIPTLLSKHDLKSYIAERRAEGKRIGFTNGVFDLVHPGHVSLLEFARDTCDVLIVGINSDASVRRLGKGPERPINSELDRAIVLAAFGMVDATVIFDEDTPLELIEAIRPDVLIKGADYTVETVVGSPLVLSYGGEVLLAPIQAGKSSSQIIQKASNHSA